uniref:Uncharacterized protein n=1 Tax=Caenorhabditis japonica TaxID=281687 RepID=A0A8R1I6Y5_CAEJA
MMAASPPRKTVHLFHVQKPLNSGAKPISLVSSMDGFESGFETDGFRREEDQQAAANDGRQAQGDQG